MKRLIALLLVVFALPLTAAETWTSPYVKGITAAQKGDWKTVADNMQRAIASKSKEEAQTRIQRDSAPYLPWYWLGMARFNLGDVTGALEAFRNSESQGAVQKTTYYASLRSTVAKAESQRTRAGTANSAEAKGIADKALTRAMSKQVEATAAGATRHDSYRRALQKLQDAFAAKKRGDLPALQQSAQLANEATDLFLVALSDSRPRVTEGTKPPATAEVKPTTPKPAAKPPVEEPLVVETELPPPPVVEKPKVPGTTTAESPAETRKAAMPREVANAFREWRAGRRERAERMLDAFLRENPRTADALMLRGCARYTRGVLGDDRRLISAAADDFRAALRLRPKARIDTRYFSPKLVRFFRDVQRGG